METHIITIVALPGLLSTPLHEPLVGFQAHVLPSQEVVDGGACAAMSGEPDSLQFTHLSADDFHVFPMISCL